MLIKLVTLLVPYLLGRTTSLQAGDRGFFANATLAHIRKILMMSAGVIAGLVLFLGGVFTVLVDMILTTRSLDQLAFSPATAVGFGLILLAFVTEWMLFSRRLWEVPLQQQAPAEDLGQNFQPIIAAVAGLIQEFTEERRVSRGISEMAVPSAAPMTGPTPGPVAYN